MTEDGTKQVRRDSVAGETTETSNNLPAMATTEEQGERTLKPVETSAFLRRQSIETVEMETENSTYASREGQSFYDRDQPHCSYADEHPKATHKIRITNVTINKTMVKALDSVDINHHWKIILLHTLGITLTMEEDIDHILNQACIMNNYHPLWMKRATHTLNSINVTVIQMEGETRSSMSPHQDTEMTLHRTFTGSDTLTLSPKSVRFLTTVTHNMTITRWLLRTG